MNAIDGATYGITIQFGKIDSNDSQNWNTADAEQTQEPNSFLSILNLLDVNADGKTDTDELKFGAGFMINTMIQSRDQNGDQTLSTEEAGISQSTAAQLDTDSDGILSAKELITPADTIIDGLVSVLDTDGDKALSPQELAIFELLFAGHSYLAYVKDPEPESFSEVAEVEPVPPEIEAIRQAAVLNQTAPSGSGVTQQFNRIVSLKA